MKNAFGLLVLYSLILVACLKDKGSIPASTSKNLCDSLKVTYSLVINPIINNKCVTCHKPGGTGNGDYTTYSGLKAKIGTNNNPLYNRVFVLGDMPQAGSPALTADEKQKISCWLDAGAPNN